MKGAGSTGNTKGILVVVVKVIPKRSLDVS